MLFLYCIFSCLAIQLSWVSWTINKSWARSDELHVRHDTRYGFDCTRCDISVSRFLEWLRETSADISCQNYGNACDLQSITKSCNTTVHSIHWMWDMSRRLRKCQQCLSLLIWRVWMWNLELRIWTENILWDWDIIIMLWNCCEFSD